MPPSLILIPDALFDDGGVLRSETPSIVAVPAAAELSGAAPLPVRASKESPVDSLDLLLDGPFDAPVSTWVDDAVSPSILASEPTDRSAGSGSSPSQVVGNDGSRNTLLDNTMADPAEEVFVPAATPTGLKRRVPGAQLPDTGPPVDLNADQIRDPKAVRNVLGGLQRGVEGARRLAEEQD